MRLQLSGLLVAATATALAGCPNAELAPLEPCTISGVVVEVKQNAVDKVDVLFVVDDSGSMLEEQRSLAEQLPRMVQILASGDLEAGSPAGTPGLGENDFPAVKDMHLGVVSTNMGVAGNTTPTNQDGSPNSCAGIGDDGLLQFPQNCGGNVSGNFLEFVSGVDDVGTLGTNFACIAQLGTSGCGQEQQLDSMLKALTAPDNANIKFIGGTSGNGNFSDGRQGGGANAGFLRKEAVLAVIVVTDEDDCSIPEVNAPVMSFTSTGNANIVNQQTGATENLDLRTPLNLRCGNYAQALYPIQRYVDGLLALKPDNPELVIFAAITGIPTVLEGMSTEQILANQTMQFQAENQADPFALDNRPVASCRRDHDGDPTTPTQDAYPPRRIVELAGRFQDNGTVQSICQDDFSSALDTIIEKISAQLQGACLPRKLIRSETGLVDCDIVELLRDTNFMGDSLCNAATGRIPDGTQAVQDEVTGTDVNYQRCLVNQVAVLGGQTAPNPDTGLSVGTYYDDFSDEVMMNCQTAPQRITYTPGAEPASGALVRVECQQPVLAFDEQDQGRGAVGLPCDDPGKFASGDALCEDRGCDENDTLTVGDCDKAYQLKCEPSSNTCQIRCMSGADCAKGWQCAKEPAEAEGYCVLPTCPALDL